MEQLLIATKKAEVYSTDETADATGLDKVDFINVKTDRGKQLQVKRSNIAQQWKRDTETNDLLVIGKNVPPVFYPGEGYDLTGKLKADGFRQKRSGNHQKEAHKSNPVLNLPNAEDIDFSEPTKKRLSAIIEEINNRTGANFDKDVTTKSLLQVKDIMLKNPHLKESAKSNTESDFELAYFDQVNKSLIKGLSQNKDFFTYLLNTPEIRKEVMGIFAQEVYRSLKKDK